MMIFSSGNVALRVVLKSSEAFVYALHAPIDEHGHMLGLIS
jgi:hypothetical protein